MTNRVNIKITGNDLKGIKNLRENLAKLQSMQAKVGVFGGEYPNGESIPEVAFQHEYGTVTKKTFKYKGHNITISGVPTRSFLRMPLDKKRYKIVGDKEHMQKYIMYALQTGHANVPLEIMGHQAEAVIQDAFATGGYGQWARNISEKYIELKGSDQPLIDTGLLRQAITSKISKKGGE